MNISGTIVKLTDIGKPVLLRVFPQKLLRKMKSKLVQNAMSHLDKIKTVPFQREKYLDGINLIGNIKEESGLGQSCRLVASELESCNIPYTIFQYNQLGCTPKAEYQQFESKLTKKLVYNINLIHMNPRELGLVFIKSHSEIWNGKYNIGFWLWELEEFPDEWVPCFNCVDEIWTPSEFISQSIRKKTDLPVITVPYHVEVPSELEMNHEGLELIKEEFLFLIMYDKNSVTQRKNPDAAIAAFMKAFKPEDNVGLILKISNCTEEEVNALKSKLGSYTKVYFLTQIMSRDEVLALIKYADVVVSLHRAEGFGLVLAEAMMLGTPVVATNWSANTEFMTHETACLVDYDLIILENDQGPFKRGNRWADPNVEQAAEYMRKLYEKPDYYKRIAASAKKHIAKCLSMNQAVDIISKRIYEIYEGNGISG